MTERRDEHTAERDSSGSEGTVGTTTATASPSPGEQPIRWYRTSTNSLVVASRDALSITLAFVVVGLVLVAISGLWPPVAVVESDSMAPQLEEGDLVLLVEPDRYGGEGADRAGIVTRAAGNRTGYERFGEPGDVIVYRPNERTNRIPIIHRAEFHVQAGERWDDRANRAWLGAARPCHNASDTPCPAPHAGYVTKGDANQQYDQTVGGGASSVAPVKPEWIRGKAILRLRLWDCPSTLSAAYPGCVVGTAR